MDIVKAAQNISEAALRRRAGGPPGSSTTESSSSGGLFFEDARPGSPDTDTAFSERDHRRKRLRLNDLELQGPISPQSTHGTVTAPPEEPSIKTEEEQERLKPLTCLQPEEQVLVYFGRKTEERLMARSDPNKSSVLKSWVNEDDGSLHIMNPKLVSVDPELFKMVLEFIQTGEYVPCIVERTQATQEEPSATRRALDGLHTVEEYSDELLRAGRLYLLAEKFKVDGLPDLIYTKITEAHLQKYTHKSLLNFAQILFATPKTVSSPGNDGASLLEAWTIKTLAEDFWTIMQYHCSLLRQVTAATAQRQLMQRLLRAIADFVDKVGARVEAQVLD